MPTAIQKQDGTAILERVVIEGDLSKLTPAERLVYYRQVCESLGLNALTRPFDYIILNGKLTLYARRECTDQLRRRDGISIMPPLETQIVSEVYIVKATARAGERTDVSTGAVNIKGLSGDALANAMMKAETKAKRRVTLSICGLGMLDESEVETVADAKSITVDAQTGEIKQAAITTNGNGHQSAALPGRPYTALILKERVATFAATAKTIPPAEGYMGILARALDMCFAPASAHYCQQNRHTVVRWLTGKASMNDLTPQELRGLGKWLAPKTDEGGAVTVTETVAEEAKGALRQALLDEGQSELFGEEEKPGIVEQHPSRAVQETIT